MLDAFKDALKQKGSPVEVIFTKQQDIDSLVADINKETKVNSTPSSEYVGSSYPCQSDVVSAFPMNKFCSEIKALGQNMFPLSISFDSAETLKKFALDYASSTPATKLVNFVEPNTPRRFFHTKPSNAPDWIVPAINICAVVGVIALLLVMLPLDELGLRKKAKHETAKIENSNPIVGTWSGTTPYGSVVYTFNDEGVCSVTDNGVDVDFGNYTIENGQIRMKFIKDKGIVTTATLQGGRISIGGGYYLTKQ